MKPVRGAELCLDKVESEDKLRLIPALPDILKHGRVVEQTHCLPSEDQNARTYITLETTVELGERLLTVRLLILTTREGENLYCPMLDEPGPDGDGLNLWIVS